MAAEFLITEFIAICHVSVAAENPLDIFRNDPYTKPLCAIGAMAVTSTLLHRQN
jgi:hypothetical protein